MPRTTAPRRPIPGNRTMLSSQAVSTASPARSSIQDKAGCATIIGWGDRAPSDAPRLPGPNPRNSGVDRDTDRQQCDDRQRPVGNRFLGAQQRDENDDPEKSCRGQCQPHRKSRRTPKVIERRSPGPVHARYPSTQHKHAFSESECRFFRVSTSRRMVLRRGPFDGGRNGTRFTRLRAPLRKRRAGFPWQRVRTPRSSS